MEKSKSFLWLFLAAILGSALTLGVFKSLGGLEKDTFKIEHVNATPGVQTFYKDPETKELIPLDFTQTAEKAMPAVVHIRSTFSRGNSSERLPEIPDFFRFFDPDGQEREQPQSMPQVGAGSGVIISEDGYIVTNNHVIADADDIEVTLFDNRIYKARVIGTDPTTDIALIQVKEKNLPTLSFVDSDKLKIGEWVVAVGNPLNLNSTVTAGIVSAKGRSINILEDRYRIESFIQTDAVINRGNSGGALVDLQGNLVGINTAIASPNGFYTGYGFAVPSNLVSKVVEDLLEFGVVQRGVLGIIISNIDGNRAKELDLSVNVGVRVDSLIEEGAAKEGGVRQGDVILSVNGQDIKSVPELQELIALQRPGDKVALKVLREGKEKDLSLVLKKLGSGNARVSVAESDVNILDKLGAEFETYPAEKAEELDIEGGGAVMLKRLTAGKLKNQTSIQEGFIITKLDNQRVHSVEEFMELLSRKSGGVMLEGMYEDRPGIHYYAFGL